MSGRRKGRRSREATQLDIERAVARLEADVERIHQRLMKSNRAARLASEGGRR